MPHAMQTMQDGRSFPKSLPFKNWSRHNEKQGPFVLHSTPWGGKGQGMFRSFSFLFLSIFQGEEQLKHEPFKKPLLRLAVTVLFEDCCIEHSLGYCAPTDDKFLEAVTVAFAKPWFLQLSTISKGPEV